MFATRVQHLCFTVAAGKWKSQKPNPGIWLQGHACTQCAETAGGSGERQAAARDPRAPPHRFSGYLNSFSSVPTDSAVVFSEADASQATSLTRASVPQSLEKREGTLHLRDPCCHISKFFSSSASYKSCWLRGSGKPNTGHPFSSLSSLPMEGNPAPPCSSLTIQLLFC